MTAANPHTIHTLIELRRFEDAERMAIERTSRYPGEAHAWEQLAVCRIRQARYREAEESCTRAISLDPTSWDAYRLRGISHHELGRYRKAESDFSTGLSINPLSDTLLLAFGILLEARAQMTPITATRTRKGKKRVDRAEQYLRESLRLEPSNGYALTVLGRVLMLKRQYPNALDALQQAVRLDPQNARSLIALGHVLIATERWEEGVSAVLEGVKCDPTEAKAGCHVVAYVPRRCRQRVSRSLWDQVDTMRKVAYNYG